jgi:hypothetical protein
MAATASTRGFISLTRSGLTSTFRYDYNPGPPDLGMTNLITAYGTTTFKRGIQWSLARELG